MSRSASDLVEDPSTHLEAPSKRPKLTIASPPIMLILVGLPGSGKSQFATNLIGRCQHHRWTRINQDNINNGKRGSKEQCLDACEIALRQGSSVVVDRTNLTPAQRRDFIQLLDPGSSIHCVAFNLPYKMCGLRAAQRQDHEGGVQGPSVYGLIGKMNKEWTEAGLPTFQEGFQSILVCENDNDIDKALDLWGKYSMHEDRSSISLMAEWKAHHNQNVARKGDDDKNDNNNSNNNNKQKEKKNTTLQTIDRFLIKSPSQKKHSTATRPQEVGSKNDVDSDANKKVKPSKITIESRHTHFKELPVFRALLRYVYHPQNFEESTVLQYDNDVVVVRDAYPKAQVHILVIARDTRLVGPLDLDVEDCSLIKKMKSMGLICALKMKADLTETDFAVGFHSVPTMKQLHLHVISKDFDSDCIKNKKHWNSFTVPAFFLDVDTVVDELTAHGRLNYTVEEKEKAMKASEMKCPKCESVLSTIPGLKYHVMVCTSKRGY